MRTIRTGPLPPDIFEWVNATHAVVLLKDGHCLVISRSPRTGQVYKGGAQLDYEFMPTGHRWIKHRWLADSRRRTLHLDTLPFHRVCNRRVYMLTDAQWEGR